MAVVSCRAAAPSLPPPPTATSSALPPTLTIAVATATPFITLAPPTRAPSAPDATEAIQALTQRLAEHVRAQQRDAYLALVDLSDPVFAREHSRWADGWASGARLQDFTLRVTNLTLQGNEAVGTLSMTWALPAGPPSRNAAYPVRFRRGAHGGWKFAGEVWQTFETEHFQIHAAPGLEALAQRIVPELPDVYRHVTTSMAYQPTTRMQVKLYGSREALGATTLLSLPPISGWNEPGEALKLFTDSNGVSLVALAHEFTHFLVFEQAGATHSRMPWWMDEGLAVFVAAMYEGPEVGERRRERVREWAATDRLMPWDQISDFDTTPVERWEFVYPQGYVFVRFVNQRFGEEQRQAWVRAMARDMDLPAATQSVLGVSFEQLDGEFKAWLRTE